MRFSGDVRRWAIPVVLIAAAVAIWVTSGGAPVVLESHPTAVMGTDCQITAVMPRRATPAGQAALRAAEAELRRVEALMSAWLADSEIARLNAAPAGTEVPLSIDSRRVLAASRQAWEASAGAFDITCRPLLELWKEAGRRGRLPSDAELAAARAESSWAMLRLTPGGATKTAPTACVDLGGIAKGYGIDRATDALRAAGCLGGLVDVGGDLRCFGRSPDGVTWRIGIRDPLGERLRETLHLTDRAVCTSGNYQRFVTIAGRRFSHIVDPRTGWPADRVPSVTVVAPTALEADPWATALSVLGFDGLSKLPAGVEALLVNGGDGSARAQTPGIARWLREPAE